MATLDNAIWLTGAGGTAESGDTVISEGGYDTTVAGTFTAGSWDGTAGGTGVSDFGAFGVTSPITANYWFSNPVEDLSFTIDHLNDDGAATYDDSWTILAYDADGDLIPAADVIAGLGGLTDETVTANPDGSVTIEAAGTIANDVSLTLAGPVSEIDLVYEPGSGGIQTGGSGISDLTFTIPPPDTDSDGVSDDIDVDDDGDGILDVDEGAGVTTPGTITVTFDGDEYAADATDNTRWELRDQDGNLIASDDAIDSTVKITNVPVSGLGDYTFTVFDDFGDGIAGFNPASYTVAIDGVVVVDSGANPNFGTATTETFTVAGVATTTDSDGDGIADHLDLDSDNDGITDNVEAQTTDGYIAPTGIDSDGDGLDDAYEATGGLTPVDTDSDGTADVIDTDSDDDGVSDAAEAGHGVDQAAIDASGDADGDGIRDVVDDVSGWDVNDADIDGAGDFTLSDSDNDTNADGSGAIPLTRDLDFRDAVPCFTPGTLIATETGEVPVETIRPGDRVMTVDNGPQVVRWVGHRSIGRAELRACPNLRPVVIRKNAFGNRRRMLVSPQHGMIIRNRRQARLLRAKHAAEAFGGKVARIDRHCTAVTYIHLMFERHELIYAEGAQTESFYPGPMALRSLDHPVLDELLHLFPELAGIVGSGLPAADVYGASARTYLPRRAALTLPKQDLLTQVA